ncbi:MAG: hypothetical protein LBJ84_04625 [Oscillospiraceae bacterium]|jgi:hypothetical protein|nr:hypothetical protein [Oscillospiraceae bacterium]
MTRNAKALWGCFCLGAIVIAATGYVAAPSVDDEVPVVPQGWGDLRIVSQGLKITAPQSDVEKYLSISDKSTQERALQELVSNPNNRVFRYPAEDVLYLDSETVDGIATPVPGC